MAADDRAGAGAGAGDDSGVALSRGKKRKYLPYARPAKKGSNPLRPGMQGFFITCDGGRERQAARESVNLLDTFYEELVYGKGSASAHTAVPSKPLNKITKFKYSDSSSDEDEPSPSHKVYLDTTETEEVSAELQAKKQCLASESSCGGADTEKRTDKPIDELIEDELKELGDKNKRHFVILDTGCNGVVFIEMCRGTKDPSPASIVQHMLSSAASTKKHMSRFILRILPAEFTCYASEEEISKAITPFILQYFPSNATNPLKFAVLYEARANTGIDRMGIINTVAKSVPQPHKVDLKFPDRTIVVQIVKTICLIGVVEKYKEFSKYNLRQLTSRK